MRDEGLTSKASAAVAEARRYQAILGKQEKENLARRKAYDRQLAESLERQAVLKDRVETLTTTVQKQRDDFERQLADERSVFKDDLSRVEAVYSRYCEELKSDSLTAAVTNDHLKVRSREELIEAGRSLERKACESLLSQAQATHKRAASQLSHYKDDAIGRAQHEAEVLQSELASLRARSSQEALVLRKEVEYLFEYSRNLAKIILHQEEKGQGGGRAARSSAAPSNVRGVPAVVPPGVTILSRRKYFQSPPDRYPIEPEGGGGGSAVSKALRGGGVPGLDLALLHHVQQCWYRTKQFLHEVRNVDVSSGYHPTVVDFPLHFVSAAGMWGGLDIPRKGTS